MAVRDHGRVRIVHIIARLNDGGPARVIAALAEALTPLGHQSVILTGACADNEPDLAPILAARGLTVECIPGLGRAVGSLSEFTALCALRRRLAALAPDVVHTHTAKAGVLGRLAAAGWAQLHTFHGHVLHGHLPRWAERLARLSEAALAPLGELHALTPTLTADLAYGFAIGRPRRWHCLPPPVAALQPRRAAWHDRLQPGVPVVGFLGRLAPVKDPLLWCAMLAELAKQRPVQALVCGDGELGTAVRERLSTLGVPMLAPGFVPAEEALAVMDVLVLSSRHEGLPLVVVEAGWAHVPVVAPPVGGLRDLARLGVVAPAGRSAAALAAATALILDGAGTRLAARGRAWAETLAPAVLAPRYAALYAAIYARHALAHHGAVGAAVVHGRTGTDR